MEREWQRRAGGREPGREGEDEMKSSGCEEWDNRRRTSNEREGRE